MSTMGSSRLWGKIIVLIAVCGWCLPAQAKYDGGSGTEAEPYRISGVSDWQELVATPADWASHFVLTADIDLNGVSVTPIAPDTSTSHGFQGTEFTGVFDGNDHIIDNARVNMPASHYVGLFGYVGAGGQIKNLGVEGTSLFGGSLTGGLVGYNGEGAISNCYSTGSVSGSSYIGGLVGGNNGGAISNCYSTGSVSGTYSYVGGLVGYNRYSDYSRPGTIINCHSSGSVTGSGDCIGGLVGLNECSVTRCYSTSAVSGNRYVGGLVGQNARSVTQCCSSGTVNGDRVVGGLVGLNGACAMDCWGVPITDSYSTSSVTATGVAGGLVGYSYGYLTRCYSTGAVSGTGDYVGGLVGDNRVCDMSTRCWPGDPATGCFWDSETSGQTTSGGGTGKTTDEMQTARTFQGWGTCGNEGVWTIDEGNDYPRLWWENQPGEAIRVATLSDLLLGTGTQNDPFLIYTREELNMIGLFPCEWDKHFKLMADIDLSGFDGKDGRPAFNTIWTSSSSVFSGTFDGNGHAISHITISHMTIAGHDCVGLFGVLGSGAEVKNLGVIDVNVSGYLVGGLVGWNWGTISNCYSTGSVAGGGFHSAVGGLVAENSYDGTISNCYSSASVTGGGYYFCVGGLVGGNIGDVNQCYSAGSVTGTGSVGGLVGSNDGTISNSFWDIETSDCNTSGGGTPKTTEEMKTQSTFADAAWDFIEVWDIGESQTYPFLRTYMAGDINHDGLVDFRDITHLAADWLGGVE